jgi:DNA-binding LytR/AlgR family response regulator
MPVRTLIIDDEPHAIEVIEKYLKDFPEILVVGTSHNAVNAAELIKATEAELLFLDIKMPGLKGTEFIKGLSDPPRVIFTTAYQEYALEGFDLDAIDYLLKPIPFPRFVKAMDKVRAVFQDHTAVTSVETAELEVSRNHNQYLYLRVKRENTKVRTSEILWIESIKDYVKVVSKDQVLVAKYKISIIEKLLPTRDFIRVHRSFIVSLDKIESYHANYVKVEGKELPIGRNYKQECYKRFLQA